jgi:replicative DNA helicase
MILLEEALLARVLHEGSAQKALSRGVHEGWFADPLIKQAWAEIVKHASRPATRNETPSIARIEKKVRGLRVGECPEEPMSEIISDMLDTRARATIQGGIVHLDELLRQEGVDAAAEYLGELSRELSRHSASTSHMKSDLADAIPDFMESYDKLADGGGIVGLPCAWPPLNEAMGGLQPGTVTILYAPPKSAKTFMGLELGAVHPFEEGNARVLVVTYEMPVRQIWRRILARLCRLEYGAVTKGKLSHDARDDCFDQLTELQETQIANMQEQLGSGYRDIRVVHGMGQGINHVRNEIEQFEPDIVLIDGLYLMGNDRQGGKRDVDWKANTAVTQDLKVLATECNIPIIGTTQANRSGSKRKAGADMDDYNDIGFGMGAIMDADSVIRLHKIKNAQNEDRILVTMPAVRETEIDAFVLRFVPMMDFGVEMINVTQEQVEHMMISDEPEVEERPRRRRRTESEQEAEFAFTNVNPFS